MEFLEFLGWMVFGYLLFQLLSAWIAMQNLKHAINDAVNAQQEKEFISSQRKLIRFERVIQGSYDVILAFGEDNRFILQGNNRAEVEQLLKEKFPNKTFYFVEETVNEPNVDQRKVTSVAD